MATAFNPQYVNLDRYEAAQIARRANQQSPLDAALQGLQQGIQLQQLPQTLQDQALQRQLANAIANQKLTDLANPQLAAQKAMQSQALEAILSGRNPNLVLQPQVAPELQAMRDVALEQAGVPAPTTDFRQVVPTLNGIPAIGLSPSAGAQVKADELQRQIQLFNAKPYNQIITREGLAFDPRQGTASDIFVNDKSVAEQRRLQSEADAKAKADAAAAILDTKGNQASDRLDRTQEFTAEQNRLNRENQISLAEKRAAAKAGASTEANSSYIQEGITRNLASIDDLKNRVGLDTVGVGSILRYIPATDARNFEADLASLKGNIAFGELAAMRAASKTGGALGAISNKELTLLESSLGALDIGQSPANFRKNLDNIKASIERWKEAAAKVGSSSTSNDAPNKSPAITGNSGTASSGIKFELSK